MGVQNFANVSLSYPRTYVSTTDGAWSIDERGKIRRAPDLLGELNPSALNKSITPAGFSRIYENGRVAVYKDDYFFVARWSPQTASKAATDYLVDLLGWLLPGQAILLCYEVGGWCVERYFSPAHAASRVRELACAFDSAPLKTTHVEQLEVSAAHKGPPFLALAWSLWQQMMDHGERHDGHAFWNLAHSHAIWITADDNSDELGLSYVGQMAPIRRHYPESWFQTCFAERLAWAGSKNRHESRVSEDYLNVAKSGQPRCDDIVGCINPEGHQNVWLQYRRLILPVPMDGSIPAILVFSELQPNKPFPFLR